MTKTLLRAGALSCALLASTALTAPAHAQTAAPAPVRQSIDGNGVDLFQGTLNANAQALSIGSGASGLAYSRQLRANGWSDNVSASLYKVGSTLYVSMGATTDSFTLSGSTYTPTEGHGATLTYNSSTLIYTYTASDGTVVRFDKNKVTDDYANEGRVIDVVRPAGGKLTFSYDTLSHCTATNGVICTVHKNAYRIAGIRNSYGYQLAFSYSEFENDPDDPFEDISPWLNQTSIGTVNLAGASTAPLASASFARVTSGGSTYDDVTDAAGRTTRFRVGTGGLIVGITLPGSASENVTITRSGGRVASVANAAGTTTYSASDSGTERTVTVTDSASHATVYVFDLASQRLKQVTDALSHVTAFQYDSSGRVTRVTRPEGDYTQLTYDGRGNVTEQRLVAKAGTGLPDVVTSAAYSSTCSNPATCNQPTSTTDARGNTTDYTYDSTHGGVLTLTAPVPTTGATRPQVRYAYTSYQAYFRNGAGSIVASGEPVTLPTGTSACRTGSSCAGTADEVVASVSYGPQTTGTGNNLLPVSTSSGAGDASLTATTAMAYDDVGNVIAVDGPLAGSDDTARMRYNVARQRVGTISADPDGAGGLVRRAVRTTYSSTTGLPTKVEQGTVAGTSDSDWAAFSAQQGQETEYDAQLRPFVQRLTSGSTTYALTQTSYDGLSRPRCSAQRMNPSEFATASLPSDACTLDTQGSFGPDRIARTSYDEVGRVIKVETGVGVTGVAADEATTTYTANGQAATVTDANGNKTSYAYDGLDRLTRTSMPSPTTAGTSSATDYEEPTYATATVGGNTVSTPLVSSLRLRDGNSIALAYDNLSRLTTKNLPGSELDVTYAYNLLGQMTSAATSAQTLSFTYDALGRQLSETGPLGTVSSAWDLAGRRTTLTHPDGAWFQQDRDGLGRPTMLSRAGVPGLALLVYDNSGLPYVMGLGNGQNSFFGHDALGRLTGLTHDLSGTGNDVTFGFTYNPASEIATSTRDNDAYAYTGHANANVASTANGLNQLTALGGTSLSYGDNRGNVTAIGSASYGYDSQNRLTSAPGSVSLTYDPLGRLYQVSDGTTTRRFLYNGQSMIAEYDGSNAMLHRYVHGEGIDNPIVQYDGSGFSAIHFLHADERGSVIALSGASGALENINRYDEYGVPQGTLTGRFGYTGQLWLPEAGLYHYRARAYNPATGRFMQADPSGYGDGMNFYAYVRDDPMNANDPSGLQVVCTGSIIPTDTCGGNPALGCSGECAVFYGVGWAFSTANGVGVPDDRATAIIRAAHGYWVGTPSQRTWVPVGSDFVAHTNRDFSVIQIAFQPGFTNPFADRPPGLDEILQQYSVHGVTGAIRREIVAKIRRFICPTPKSIDWDQVNQAIDHALNVLDIMMDNAGDIQTGEPKPSDAGVGAVARFFASLYEQTCR